MAAPVATVTDTAFAAHNVSPNMTLDVPTGASVNDLLIVCAFNDSTASTPQFNAVTGWTLKQQEGNNGSDSKVGIYYRVVDGTEPSSYTFGYGTPSYDKTACMIHVTGAATTDIFGADDTVTINVASTLYIGSSSYTLEADTLALVAIGFEGSDGELALSSGSVTDGWSMLFDDIYPTSPSAAGVSSFVGQYTASDAGETIGSTVLDAGSSDGHVGARIQIRPGGGGGGSTGQIKVKASGTFSAKPVKAKISGTFSTKPVKYKSGGTFTITGY